MEASRESDMMRVIEGKQNESFTERQGQYLAYIATYTKLHRRPPAEADIQAYFGVTPPSVHNMIVTLEKRGLIARIPGQARSIEVLVPSTRLPELK
jgi:DNA-binding MarR family transcriptional regulator